MADVIYYSAEMTDRNQGIACIVASALGFAIMATCVRLCDDFGGPISSFQKSFFRNLLALVISTVVFIRHRAAHPDISVTAGMSLGDWGVLTLRSVVGTIGIFANFYALSHITIAEGQTLNKTAPFFTVLFAWLLLGEKVRWRQTLPLAIAFGGVLLIAKPGFAGASALPLAMGVLGGAAAGIAYTAVRQMGLRKVEPTLIVLFFSAFSCLASVPFMCLRPDPMTWPQTLILLGAGAGAALGQFGITAAYRFAAPKDIAVFDYSNVIFTAAFGWLLFRQIPDYWSVTGIIAIIGAAWLLIEAREAR